jgi:multicomponent Na+:H+ antiporter subunit F
VFEIPAILIGASSLIVLYRAVSGPTVYDRVLAINAIGTKTILILVLIGFIFERPHFLDIALVYAIINFIGTIAFLKYIKKHKLE